jgi:hypothetical protein
VARFSQCGRPRPTRRCAGAERLRTSCFVPIEPSDEKPGRAERHSRIGRFRGELRNAAADWDGRPRTTSRGRAQAHHAITARDRRRRGKSRRHGGPARSDVRPLSDAARNGVPPSLGAAVGRRRRADRRDARRGGGRRRAATRVRAGRRAPPVAARELPLGERRRAGAGRALRGRAPGPGRGLERRARRRAGRAPRRVPRRRARAASICARRR